MPSPVKETWAHRHREKLGVPVTLCVGGSFDVLAGKVRRAPRWMQQAGLEWFWRLLMEPRRLWKRYLSTTPRFVCLLAAHVLARPWSGRPASGPMMQREACHDPAPPE